MSDKNRRQIRIIDGYQYRLIITLILLIIAVSAVLVGALFLMLRHTITILPQPLPENFNLHHQLLDRPFLIVIIIALVLFIIAFWILIVITHKVYGPIYRLGKYIKAMTRGEKTGELHFRKGDAIDHMADLYNELYGSLHKSLHYNYNELVTIFSELEDLLDQVYKRKIDDSRLFNTLQNLCNRVAKALDLTLEKIKPR
jgi:methyl-accepting chemotaxis protein